MLTSDLDLLSKSQVAVLDLEFQFPYDSSLANQNNSFKIDKQIHLNNILDGIGHEWPWYIFKVAGDHLRLWFSSQENSSENGSSANQDIYFKIDRLVHVNKMLPGVFTDNSFYGTGCDLLFKPCQWFMLTFVFQEDERRIASVMARKDDEKKRETNKMAVMKVRSSLILKQLLSHLSKIHAYIGIYLTSNSNQVMQVSQNSEMMYLSHLQQ